MLVPVLLFIVGLLFLIKGGDWFVDGASALARRFHLPELLIGATVVSIGTTLPEVMVSTMSAVSGHGEIAYGNAIGSVICNSALIAAITIAVRPGKVDPKTLKTPVIFFFIAAAIYCVAAYGFGEFTRPMGFIMLAMFVAYMVVNVLQMKNAPAVDAETSEEEEMSLARTLILLVLGMIMDMAPIILIATPILLPIATSIGIDPIQFGIIVVLNCGIGLLTPPVGAVLFIGSAVAKRPMEKVVKATLPFYLCMFVALLLLTFIPDISLAIPKLLGGYVSPITNPLGPVFIH